MTQNIHANCFRLDYGLHFYSTRVRFILMKPLNSRMTEAVPIRPTDFNEHYAFYTIQYKMVILPNFEKPTVSIWLFKIDQYVACFPNSVSNMSVEVTRKQVQKMRV
jgi:hypothetical protein